MITVKQLKEELGRIADARRAGNLQRFFKTGIGEYGEGDIFLGITVPQSRKIAQKYKNLDFSSIEKLLHSKFHEERLIALLILICKFNAKDLHSNILKNVRMRKKIYSFYLRNTKYINNWDLVDLSAHKIVGAYLLDKSFDSAQGKNFSVLIKLSKSKNFWERRIAVLATFQFIKNNQFDDSLKIAKMLLKDEHDLIHKAVGWMLREVGKRDLKTEIKFLDKHYSKMPRTMLRYSIEKFPKEKRNYWLER